MLSYLHSFHAGCIADVHKHGILSLLLAALTKKDRPITYMETHAGRGIYDLESEEALKTNEAKAGILNFQTQWKLSKDHPYQQALDEIHKSYGSSFYPGSPAIAKSLLRSQDHMHLMELHPKEIEVLKHYMNDKTIHCHHRDGYEGVLGVSPPKARRGLVLIDPSFEIKTEYQTCVTFIKKLVKKWPEASICLWYPMLESKHYSDMVDSLDHEAFDNVEHRTLLFPAFESKDKTLKNKNHKEKFKGMSGTGFYIINCPWGVTEDLNDYEDHLKKVLKTSN